MSVPPESLLTLLPDVVPKPDDRLVTFAMLEGEHTHAGRATIEEAAVARRQPEPAGRDHADDVATRERQDVAVDAADLGNKVVGPGRDVPGGFAVGAAVLEQFPVCPVI